MIRQIRYKLKKMDKITGIRAVLALRIISQDAGEWRVGSLCEVVLFETLYHKSFVLFNDIFPGKIAFYLFQVI